MNAKRRAARRAWPALLTLGLALPGCVMGPKQIDAGHLRYNNAIQQSFGRELLLNLVRMRYREPAEFVEIGGVAAQYSFEGNASLNGNLVDGILNLQNLGLGAGVSGAERPTITYAPLRGKQFELCVLAPVDMTTLWLLANKGWRVDRILRVAVRSMNVLDNATAAGGPTPSEKPEYERFLRATQLFRELQKQRAAEFVLATREVSQAVPISPEKLSADFVFNATQKGYRIEAVGNGVVLKRNEPYSALVIDPRLTETPSVRELVALLQLEPRRPVYEFSIARQGRIASAYGDLLAQKPGEPAKADNAVHPAQGLPPASPPDPELPGLPPGPQATAPPPQTLPPPLHPGVALQSRSIYEMMYYLSQGVEVPADHLRKGLVNQTHDRAGFVYDWNLLLGDIFRVHVSRWPPRDAYLAVPYRGYWYYVLDSDLESKSTLSLLQELFNLQVRGGAGEGSLPVLTLGVGGR
jgi:hypothetical protein